MVDSYEFIGMNWGMQLSLSWWKEEPDEEIEQMGIRHLSFDLHFRMQSSSGDEGGQG